MQQVMRNPRRTRWNKGKRIGPKPWLRQKYAWTIRTKLQIEQRKCVIWQCLPRHRQQATRLRRGCAQGRRSKRIRMSSIALARTS
jgi:hypothetical protein